MNLAEWIFEWSVFDPLTTCLFVGFAALGWDGQIYLTASGQDYLDGLDATA